MNSALNITDDATAKYWAALAGVLDPEVPVLNILDLGLVRGLKFLGKDTLEVALTPTYTGCPATKLIEENVEAALITAGAKSVSIKTQLSPPWTTDWMSAEGREKLKAYGIAPPRLSGEVSIACPQCGSIEVIKVSEFGSTACKALYKCDDCLEPFDYFKCI